MIKMNRHKCLSICVFAATIALAGCVSVPEQFAGDYPALFPLSAGEADVGTRIRWGGVILDTRPEQDQTCFELLSKPLQRSMRPAPSDRTEGRFIACKAGFHDPEVFARGRELTLTGRIVAIENRKVGDFDYRYPIVAADFVSMWPERQDVIVYDRDWFYSPWYWHYPYYRYPYPSPPPRHRQIDKGERLDLPSTRPDGG